MSKSPVKVKAGEVKREEKKEEPLEEGACPHCHKKHIDLTGSVTFFGYRDSDKKGCFRRCQDMLNSCGYKSVSVKDPSVFQMTKCNECESKNNVLILQEDNSLKGIYKNKTYIVTMVRPSIIR